MEKQVLAIFAIVALVGIGGLITESSITGELSFGRRSSPRYYPPPAAPAQAPVIPQIPCLDYDGGVNVLVPSNALGLFHGAQPGYKIVMGTARSSCNALPQSPTMFHSLLYDCCLSPTQLQEAYCVENKAKYQQVSCPGGCQGGRCLPQPAQQVSPFASWGQGSQPVPQQASQAPQQPQAPSQQSREDCVSGCDQRGADVYRQCMDTGAGEGACQNAGKLMKENCVKSCLGLAS